MKTLFNKLTNRNLDFDANTISQISYCKFLYKLCLDFKTEAENLRDPHLIERYLNNINLDKLKSNPNLLELLLQLEPFNIKNLFYIDTDSFSNIDISADIIILEDSCFRIDIARGDYKKIYAYLNEFQTIMFARLGKASGQIVTPSVITILLKRCLDINNEETLLDPFWGTGSMALNIGEESHSLFGQDINPHMLVIGKINSVVANKNTKLTLGHSLLTPGLDIADVVVSNYPFGTKSSSTENKNLLKWGQPSRMGGELLGITLALAQMKKRGAIIATEGILFKSSIDGKVRANIINDNLIDTIISLPPNIFNSTSIATSVVFLNKNKINNDILFIDSKDLFMKIRGGVTISSENLNKIVNTYDTRKSIDSISSLVPIDTVKENDYVLTVNRYVSKTKKHKDIDLEELSNEINILGTKILSIRSETNTLLRTITGRRMEL